MSKNNYTKEEQLIVDKAVSWAKANKKVKARELTDTTKYQSDTDPVAFFMAGCPAAGKTEFAKAFAKAVGKEFNDDGAPIMHIDADQIREWLPNYSGENSRLFQYPASIILDKAFDLIMKNCQSFILDGTLSDPNIAISNTERCLKRKYDVKVLFAYNDPILAWEAAKMREVRDGRAVPMDIFIDRYFKSKESIRILKDKFGRDIQIDLLFKELNNNALRPEFNIDNIDNHLPEKYTPASLKQALLESEEGG
jgi:predicted ABC-type ATPase